MNNLYNLKTSEREKEKAVSFKSNSLINQYLQSCKLKLHLAISKVSFDQKFKKCMKLSWNFQRGGGILGKKIPSVGAVWIFSGIVIPGAGMEW